MLIFRRPHLLGAELEQSYFKREFLESIESHLRVIISIGLLKGLLVYRARCWFSTRTDSALFAVWSAGKALVCHAGPAAATLLGILTGIGGGMVRDVLPKRDSNRLAD